MSKSPDTLRFRRCGAVRVLFAVATLTSFPPDAITQLLETISGVTVPHFSELCRHIKGSDRDCEHVLQRQAGPLNECLSLCSGALRQPPHSEYSVHYLLRALRVDPSNSTLEFYITTHHILDNLRSGTQIWNPALLPRAWLQWVDTSSTSSTLSASSSG
jgi:hypothetical protein